MAIWLRRLPKIGSKWFAAGLRKFQSQRNGDRIRLITRNDYDWTKPHPWIVESTEEPDEAFLHGRRRLLTGGMIRSPR